MLRKLFWKLNKFFLKKKYPVQLLLLWLLNFAVLIPIFLPVVFVLNEVVGENEAGPDIHDSSLWFRTIVIAPVLETLIYQHLIFWLYKNIVKTSKYYACAILISAILFGIAHTYSLQYIFFAFFVGLVLGYSYYFYHKNPKKAFWSVAIVHCMQNSFVTLIGYFIPTL